MKNTELLVSLAIAITALASSCSHNGEPAKELLPVEMPVNSVTLSAVQARTAGIELGMVQWRTISGVIQASGVLDVPPQSKVSITAPLGGFVRDTKMLQGLYVKKGEVIAVMENPEYIQLQQDYRESVSQLAYLEEEYQRQQSLLKESVSARKTFEKAKADYEGMRAKADGLGAKLRLININAEKAADGPIQGTANLYAPISGFVTKVNVNIGSFVNPTDIMFEIVNTEHLHAELTVFEKDVPKLKVGQKVLFTLANESKEREAEVYLVGKEIDADRSIRIHCHLQTEDRDLVPGMYLKAVVETDSARVTALPSSAIVNYEAKQFIFVALEDNGNEKERTFRPVEVGTGKTEFDHTEVMLPPGFDMHSRVVVHGAFDLLAKLKNTEEGE